MPITLPKRYLAAVAMSCFYNGSLAPFLGYLETSAALMSRNTARVCVKMHNHAATPRNVNAYLAGVASALIGCGA